MQWSRYKLANTQMLADNCSQGITQDFKAKIADLSEVHTCPSHRM